MKITSLYRDYVQKSRMFLYPTLGIKRGHSCTPIETYISWEGLYKKEDHRYICLYHLRHDSDFKLLERVKLIGNPLFDTFIQIEEDLGAYVFDFNSCVQDFDAFMAGRYSQFSNLHKRQVLSFFKNVRNYVYIESYLYPKKYIPLYAELLSNDKQDVFYYNKLLTEVGELCSKPDLEMELLKKPVPSHLDIQNLLNLHKTKPTS